MKPSRQQEQAAAERLVALLVERHRLPLRIHEIHLAINWKISFEFVPQSSAVFYRRRSARYGRRPGLEIDWLELRGDVDAWQFAGDLVSLAGHGWQIVKKWITGQEERPSKLLAVVEQQGEKKPQMNTDEQR